MMQPAGRTDALKLGALTKRCALAIVVGIWTGAGAVSSASAQDIDMAPLMTAGKTVFADNCAMCHGPEGQGTGNAPALDGNIFVESRGGVISQVLSGAEDHGMPPFADVLSDDEIAAVVTYIRTSWGNRGAPVSARQANELRSATLN